MAAPANDDAPYYKDLDHNLGYKPIVRAFTYMSAYSVTGWRQLPIYYYEREWVDGIGWAIVGRTATYEHINNNTIRFYGNQNREIAVQLFLEPREDAWYE
jgi:hypothetical protein